VVKNTNLIENQV